MSDQVDYNRYVKRVEFINSSRKEREKIVTKTFEEWKKFRRNVSDAPSHQYSSNIGRRSEWD